jgi:hypothetical protein
MKITLNTAELLGFRLVEAPKTSTQSALIGAKLGSKGGSGGGGSGDPPPTEPPP